MNKNKILVGLTLMIGCCFGAFAASVTTPPKVANPKTAEPIVSSSQALDSQEIDRVIAVVNKEVITERELQAQVKKLKQQLAVEKRPLPSDEALSREVLQKLIDDSIMYQFVTQVDKPPKISDAELDGIISNIAAQNKITVEQLKASVLKEGMSYPKYRKDLAREVIVTRYRQGTVESRVKISDAEIEAFINARKGGDSSVVTNSAPDVVDLAQILVPIPTGASGFEISSLKAKAQSILDQATQESEFLKFGNQLSVSDRTIKAQDLGPRTLDRLPQVFVDAIAGVSSGKLVPQVVQSPAGFHILKVMDRKSSGGVANNSSKSESIFVNQSDINHLMLSARQGSKDDDMIRKLKIIRDQIKAKTIGFEEAAKKYSEDPNVKSNNGHMGWISPGLVPPEFEDVISQLNPGQISDPFKTEFGWHLVQVLNKKQVEISAAEQKEYARATLRQEKIARVTQDLLREMRDNATIELRPPYVMAK
jgi:peptidyl-prolyl cis-trans isomerase SurA